MPSIGRTVLRLTALVLVLVVPARAADRIAAAPDAVDARLARSLEAFWNVEYGTAEELARSVLAAPAVDKAQMVEAHKCLACVYVMQKERRQALASLVSMFQLDPAARYSPDANYPPPVIRTYHEVRDSLFAGTMDVATIAIGDFENNSVYTGKFKDYDFGALARALPHLVGLDLAEVTSLKLVDRQRIAEVLKELAISESGMADPKNAVKAGQLLGAHAYVFGQYMLLSADQVRIDARVVRTATGEVLTARQVTAKFDGKPETFLALEKQLVTELMRTLDVELGRVDEKSADQMAAAWFARRKATVGGRPGYVDGIFLTADALAAEEAGDWPGAIEKWKAVSAADPGSETARIRIKVLEQTVAAG
jgi:TolB-like protein